MIIEINQNKKLEWEIYGETYDSPFKAISKVIAKESSKHDELDIQLNFQNGLTQLRNHKGELYPEEYKNNTTCKEVVRGCPVVKSSCQFPSCKLDMACEKTKEELDEFLNKNNNIIPMESEIVTSSIKQYFDYQEEINTINNKKNKLEKAQKELYDNIKTDIETVFTAFDSWDLGNGIKLTPEGIEIKYPVKIKNDYGLLYPLNTDLFTQLNKVIGVNGTLDIESEREFAGHKVYTLILTYKL